MVDISENKRLINSDADSDHSGDLSSSAGGTWWVSPCSIIIIKSSGFCFVFIELFAEPFVYLRS